MSAYLYDISWLQCGPQVESEEWIGPAQNPEEGSAFVCMYIFMLLLYV